QRPVSGPLPRASPAMAYDSARHVTVLFGGEAPAYGDTWEWDGSAWTRQATSGPSPRAYAGMAYDAARSSMVLFGGNNDDTWEWNCAGLSPSVHPASRIICSLGSAILTASTANPGPNSYQWQWRSGPGSDWIDVIDGPNTVPGGVAIQFIAAGPQSS